ncbi:hypothetical protein BCON_0695g00040 [Botryotinia convoluta]|uniref:Uncharacterized protein n=1 Tax=Botryotinia convoluta TaxID=54673 RepID=A0A4Z1HG05_9HELO|nr:hypothetical protein BCON_0695g00040 [Botryotinia convoluta]
MAAPTHTGSFYLYANAGEIIAVGSVLPSLAILAVAERLYTRHTHKAGVGLDDGLVAASLVIVIGMGISLIIGTLFLYLLSRRMDSDHTLLGVKKYALGYPAPTPPDLTPEAILSQKLPQITITQKVSS